MTRTIDTLSDPHNISNPTLNSSNSTSILGRIITEINRMLNRGAEVELIFDLVFNSLDLEIPFDRIGIAVIEDEWVTLKWMKSKVPNRNLKMGYSALISNSLQKILHSDQPRILNNIPQYLTENPTSESTQLILKDGIQSSLTCPLRSEGKPIGFVFFSSCKASTYNSEHINVFLDIAEELSVIIEQARLRKFFHANKSKEQNIRMMLHDLKSPLSVIQGFLEIAIQEDWFQELDERKKNIFSILLRNTNFMFEMTNELSEINQLDSPHFTLKIKTVLLKEFCTELIVDYYVLAQKKNICFTHNISPNLPKDLRFDPHKIREVLDNLFTNAMKFSSRGSQIELTISANEDKLYFSVKDNGQGIPNDELPKLFNEYSKTSIRPTEGETSTGLGLSIARRIVEQHGGKIDVESTTGQGSNFTFWLPLSTLT